MLTTEEEELGMQTIERDIYRLGLAITYAALTDRLHNALEMTDTLARLVHVYANDSMIGIKEHKLTDDAARDYANATSASVYMATIRYKRWLEEDSNNDS